MNSMREKSRVGETIMTVEEQRHWKVEDGGRREAEGEVREGGGKHMEE